jgi:hypothetical protein
LFVEDEEKDDAGYDENSELEKGFVDLLFDEIDDLRMQESSHHFFQLLYHLNLYL